MKNRKGFTLIELLAVIVILAILALIVSPIISGAIEDARMQASSRSIEGFVQSTELAQVKYQSKHNGMIAKNISELSIEGKSIDKVTVISVNINNAGLIDKMKAKVDGFYCKYTANVGGTCQKEPFKQGTLDRDFIYIAGLTEKQVGVISFYNDGRTLDGTVVDVSAHGSLVPITMYVKENTINSLLMDLSIVSTDDILFPEDSSYLFSKHDPVEVTSNTIDSKVSFLDNIKDVKPKFMLTDSTYISMLAYNFNNSIDTSNVTNMEGMFKKNVNITSLDLSNFDTSNVENMSYMFGECTQLKNVDLSKFETSNVTNMSYMFDSDSSLLSLDLLNFNTSKVIYLDGMLYECINLSSLNLLSFNTSNVLSMWGVFCGCESIASIDVSSFDTSKVIEMSEMFKDCYALKNIYVNSTLWNVSSVTDSLLMFYYSSNLPNYINNSDVASSDVTHANTGTTGYLTEKE